MDTVEFMVRGKKTRRVWPVVTAAVAVNAVGLGALVVTTDVLDALHEDQVSVTLTSQAVTPTEEPTTPQEAGPSTPAAQLIADLTAGPTPLLSEGFGPVIRTADPTPTTPPCLEWPAGAHVLTATPPGDSIGGSLVQVLTTPTGAGTSVVTGWRQALGRCGNVTAARSTVTGPTGAASAYTVGLRVGGQVVTQTVWSRGDVVAIVSYAPSSPARGVVTGEARDRMRSLVEAVDSGLVAALTPVCADLNPSAADALRNPAVAGYTPYSIQKTIPLQGIPAVKRPAPSPPLEPFPLPEAVPVPELAPVAPLTVDQWVDTDDDGVGDTAPTLDNAIREPAPNLIDPNAFTQPVDNPVSPGKEPQLPTPAENRVTYTVQIPDPIGPGCGWSFNATPGPVPDQASLAAAERAAYEGALVRAATARATLWAQQLAWADDWGKWSADMAKYRRDQDYRDAHQAAVNAYQAAVNALHASQDAYRQALANPPTPANPAPTPTPTPTPDLPTDPEPNTSKDPEIGNGTSTTPTDRPTNTPEGTP